MLSCIFSWWNKLACFKRSIEGVSFLFLNVRFLVILPKMTLFLCNFYKLRKFVDSTLFVSLYYTKIVTKNLIQLIYFFFFRKQRPIPARTRCSWKKLWSGSWAWIVVICDPTPGTMGQFLVQGRRKSLPKMVISWSEIVPLSQATMSLVVAVKANFFIL